jgi:hypothetical protein
MSFCPREVAGVASEAKAPKARPKARQFGARLSAFAARRNFEGRKGFRARTHLVSPATPAAAIAGPFVDIRKWN